MIVQVPPKQAPSASAHQSGSIGMPAVAQPLHDWDHRGRVRDVVDDRRRDPAEPDET